MILQTSKGIEFLFDFNTEEGYKTSRAIMQSLIEEGIIEDNVSKDELLIDLVGAISTLQKWEDDVVTMVSRHYYSILKQKFDSEEIDNVDFHILLGKFTIDELNNRWL
jgi:hypothetical protein